MELVSTMEISGEEREIADAYARGQIEGINSNLDGLGYGENGAYNLLEVSEDNVIFYNVLNNYKLTDDGFITTGTCLIGFIAKVKPNTKYHYGAIGNNCAIGSWRVREYSSKPTSWDDSSFIIQSVNSGDANGISIVFTTTENTQYIIACKYEENTNAVISQMQITESDVATPYKPYIPSVKMLADEVSARNESLDDYGLGNKFDGNLRQGFFNDNSVWTNSTSDVTSNSLFTCKAGDVVTVKASKESNIYIKFFDSSNNMLQKANSTQTKEFTQKAPTNAVKFAFSLSYSNIKPSDFSHVGIYINNAIDELKNDLSKQCKKDDITTNETLIGTFNGKNYYRKLFTGISGSGGSVTVNVGGKIEIYNYYGRAYTYGQSGASDVKYQIPNKNYYIDSQNASETSFQLTIPTSSDTRKVDLVIEYTKVDE